eukprot:CAMPEP_0171455402 /NCGR_PEP_ID=MMETSP0945-20130129/2312_1 /TAXON_ID=109269 /ORGANISM="Vaucheria litorea, Strain CCMP2940" /LENGTH=91 /DNA_ID=CAMNT_0011980637 /DNA_START=1000 /DNA_END=1272 /DNA_ORIENTATION=+
MDGMGSNLALRLLKEENLEDGGWEDGNSIEERIETAEETKRKEPKEAFKFENRGPENDRKEKKGAGCGGMGCKGLREGRNQGGNFESGKSK